MLHLKFLTCYLFAIIFILSGVFEVSCDVLPIEGENSETVLNADAEAAFETLLAITEESEPRVEILLATTTEETVPTVKTLLEVEVSTESGIEFYDADNNETSLCNETDETIIYRDPENCTQYFISCVLSEIPQTDSPSHNVLVLKESYKTFTKQCQGGYMFDNIEKVCLVADQVNCNASQEFICPTHYEVFPDSVQPSVFIECLNGTAKRQNCRPQGTIFDQDTKTCIKSPAKFEPLNLSLTLLKGLLWIISSTMDSMSPWMKTIKLNGTLVKSKNSSFLQYDIEDMTHFSDSNNSNETFINLYNANATISDDNEYEDDDELVILSKDPVHLALYYGVMAGGALSLVLSWLLFACLCSKIFRCCEETEDDDLSDTEFYRYNQNDKYIMTRM